jgi:hypothetical protein
LERIFPEADGLVVRYDRSFNQCIRDFYTGKFRLIKATTDYVTRSAGERILAAAETAPENQVVRAAADAARAAGDLIVYVNMRVENRTMVDPADFCEALVDLFASLEQPATLVIDGHDRRRHDDPLWLYASVGEHAAKRDPISVEREIAERMRIRAAGTCVTVVSTIGSTIAQSLLWCRSAHFFVATWGAALAKCRWVCNKPGLVLSSRVNLTSTGDLLIYSSEQYNENPAPIRFIDPSAVTDAPGVAQILEMPGSFYVNFDVDMKAVQDVIFEMIEAYS